MTRPLSLLWDILPVQTNRPPGLWSNGNQTYPSTKPQQTPLFIHAQSPRAPAEGRSPIIPNRPETISLFSAFPHIWSTCSFTYKSTHLAVPSVFGQLGASCPLRRHDVPLKTFKPSLYLAQLLFFVSLITKLQVNKGLCQKKVVWEIIDSNVSVCSVQIQLHQILCLLKECLFLLKESYFVYLV